MTAIDNTLSQWLFAVQKDTPTKTWWNADFENRAPIYRAIRIDPADFAASYAIAPFRIARIDGRAIVLAAYPAPHCLAPADEDFLRIETVLAWDPNGDNAHIVGDVVPQLVGNLTDETNAVFASPRAFFQAWAIRRAQFAMLRRQHTGKAWASPPSERDEVPGALLIGDMTKVRLSPSTLPAHIEVVGIDPKELNRAIMRAARLPRVSAKPSDLRRAA